MWITRTQMQKTTLACSIFWMSWKVFLFSMAPKKRAEQWTQMTSNSAKRWRIQLQQRQRNMEKHILHDLCFIMRTPQKRRILFLPVKLELGCSVLSEKENRIADYGSLKFNTCWSVDKDYKFYSIMEKRQLLLQTKHFWNRE